MFLNNKTRGSTEIESRVKCLEWKIFTENEVSAQYKESN